MRAIVVAILSVVCAAAAPRQELPVHQTGLPDGELRYSVPVKIGGTTVETMLDTGSTGLRVLPGVLGSGDYTATSASSDYHYGSGARYQGVVATAEVQLGDLPAATVRFQAIATVGCVATQPACPASRIALADYGIGGSGFAKAGFKAILGTRFGPAEVDHPFAPLGVTRWIVELPKPGDANPGRLILNPAAAETEGYTLFRMPDRRSSAMPGCLVNLKTSDKACGRFLLDTGAPGFFVESKGPVAGLPWANGTPAEIALANADGKVMSLRFAIGAGHGTAIGLDPHSDLPFTRLSGVGPYFVWSVYYDEENRIIGLKSR
jgi:hypothetical protein